ncbi:hypothetical protein CDD81_7566 [Ophiocordyceps australis]|uniref:Uncharacterized protein n=1 Tax=Ophiocordyceps australis TaxID=1399860 RepID=A0A2C5Y346_9HYPO|nr:hypothetical protein CDD81_7566 [Ophiocordyceps australis]
MRLLVGKVSVGKVSVGKVSVGKVRQETVERNFAHPNRLIKLVKGERSTRRCWRLEFRHRNVFRALRTTRLAQGLAVLRGFPGQFSGLAHGTHPSLTAEMGAARSRRALNCLDVVWLGLSLQRLMHSTAAWKAVKEAIAHGYAHATQG